jgi:cytidylate kinase
MDMPSTGKSTLAKMLSRHYQIPFIDSGALYRGITLYALEKGFFKDDKLDQEALSEALDGLNLRFDPETGGLCLNGENVSQKIRLPQVSDHVSNHCCFDHGQRIFTPPTASYDK